ncbi:MAG: sulfotransferase family protein [bacterium]
MPQRRICLWSSPRNISTALMYSFAQRKDTRVIDEPLYAHYLRVSNAHHPGRDEILSDMENDGEKVVTEIIEREYPEEVIFFKQMTHHLTGIDESFLERVSNIFLIRNPAQIISSFAEVIPDVTMRDIGIERQFDLYNNLKASGQHPVILDSGEILKDPEKVLHTLCSTVGIPFDYLMLHWKAGPLKEDGIWAKYWYENVHCTTGFKIQKTSNRILPTQLKPLSEKCMPYYEKMFEDSIKA